MKGGFHLLDNKYELFLDTNALLNLGNNAFKENFIISQKTLEEIENIKSSSNKDGEVKWKARNISRLLDVNYGNYTVIPNGSEITKIISDFDLPYDKPDNIIIASAYYYNNHNHPVIVCSDDLNCKFISRNIFRLPTKGISEIDLVKNIEEYKGVSAKYSCGFSNPLDSSIIVDERYLDYFTTIMEDRLWQLLAKPLFQWLNRSDLSMNVAKAA